MPNNKNSKNPERIHSNLDVGLFWLSNPLLDSGHWLDLYHRLRAHRTESKPQEFRSFSVLCHDSLALLSRYYGY